MDAMSSHRSKELHSEISPTKSSRRLMRQISALGMADPVFGEDDQNAVMEMSFTSISLPPGIMMFDDMGFEDLPKDMRDAISVASDPTAAYSMAVQRHLLGALADNEEREETSCLIQCEEEEDDETTCSLTKDTLLAEAAQALEGRVSSALIHAARYQLHHKPTTKHRPRPPHKPTVTSQPEKHRILPTMDSIFPMS